MTPDLRVARYLEKAGRESIVPVCFCTCGHDRESHEIEPPYPCANDCDCGGFTFQKKRYHAPAVNERAALLEFVQKSNELAERWRVEENGRHGLDENGNEIYVRGGVQCAEMLRAALDKLMEAVGE